MKTLAVLVLSLAVANAYRAVGPPVFENVHARSSGAKIVGGVAATQAQGPWQISLNQVSLFGSSHICGGSIVGSRAVLTAAHCCDGGTTSSLTTKYGGLVRTTLPVTNAVTAITKHPNWNTNTIDADWCLLTLANAVVTSDAVQIIPIADTPPASGTTCHLTGWGRTSGSSSTLPTALQYTSMSILSAADCHLKWGDVNAVTSNMICAQSATSSGCNGDSGGPLTVDGQLVGVVSWGANGCPQDTTTRPTVYACAATGKSWVLGKMAEYNAA